MHENRVFLVPVKYTLVCCMHVVAVLSFTWLHNTLSCSLILYIINREYFSSSLIETIQEDGLKRECFWMITTQTPQP